MRIMTEAELQKRISECFFGTMHKLNAEAQMRAPETVSVISSEARQLISILRDETQSKATYERCVAIVGERGA